MSARRITIPSRRLLHHSRLLQIVLLIAIWAGSEAVVRATGLPVPGAILGMAIVLLLLATGRLSLFSMQRGANLLLAEMLLFFIPPVLGLLQHTEFLGLLGLKVLVVVALGTVSVMAVTGLAVDLCYRWMSRHAPAHSAVE